MTHSTRGLRQVTIKQKYVSEADRFLADFNADHKLTESQKAEIARSQKIFDKRNPKPKASKK